MKNILLTRVVGLLLLIFGLVHAQDSTSTDPGAVTSPPASGATVSDFNTCVTNTFGVPFKDLKETVQVEVLKSYDRYAVNPCSVAIGNTFRSAPSISFLAYIITLVAGAVIALILSATRNSIVMDPATTVTQTDPANPGVPMITHTAEKLSISRVIALVGAFAIIVTFAMTAEYAFWALTVRNDNTIFNQSTQNLLLPGLIAFLPYVANRVFK